MNLVIEVTQFLGVFQFATAKQLWRRAQATVTVGKLPFAIVKELQIRTWLTSKCVK